MQQRQPDNVYLPRLHSLFSLCQLQPRQRQQFAVLSLPLSLSLCLAMNDTKVSFGNWQSGTKVACLPVCLPASLPAAACRGDSRAGVENMPPSAKIC